MTSCVGRFAQLPQWETGFQRDTAITLRKHLARSVAFLTALYNGHGIQGIKVAWATGLRINIIISLFLLFRGYLVTTGSVSALLDTHGSLDAWMLGRGVCKDNGRKQKRHEIVTIDGLNRKASKVSSHTDGGLFLVSSAPLVKPSRMSVQGKPLQWSDSESHPGLMNKREAGKPLISKEFLLTALSVSKTPSYAVPQFDLSLSSADVFMFSPIS